MPMRRVRARLVVALSLILGLAFLFVGFINYWATRNSVRAELETTLPLTGESIYSKIHGDLMRPIFIASLMANDTFLQDWAVNGETDQKNIVKYLREIKEKYGFFTTFFVSAQTSRYYYFKGVLKTISRGDAHDIWFYRFVQSNREYVLEVDTNQAAEDSLTIFINFRVQDKIGRLIGVTGVGLNMEKTAGLLKSYGRRKRRILMVDPAGLVQVGSDKTTIRNQSIRDQDGLAELADKILIPRNEHANFRYQSDGKNMMLSVRYIPEFNWYLLVEQDEAAAMVQARANLIRTVAVGGAVSLLVIALTIFTVNIYHARLERMAKTDELTGLANRRELESEFQKAAARRRRGENPFSAAMLDIDGFKMINDRFGHLQGDRILCALADILRNNIRASDLAARWGGDEFCLLLEGDLSQGAEVVKRILQTAEKVLAESFAAIEAEIGISASYGLAEYLEGDSLDSLLKRADESLYRDKGAAAED